MSTKTQNTKKVGSENWNVSKLAEYIGLPEDKVRKQDAIVLEAMVNQARQLETTKKAKEAAEKAVKSKTSKSKASKTKYSKRAKALQRIFLREPGDDKGDQTIRMVLEKPWISDEEIKEKGGDRNMGTQVKKTLQHLHHMGYLNTDPIKPSIYHEHAHIIHEDAE